jgi:hypothetical protein
MNFRSLIGKLDQIANKQNLMESPGRVLGNTPRDNLIKRFSPTVMDNETLMKAVKKTVNNPEFTEDLVLKIVDAGDTLRHPVGKFIQKEFEELQYDMGRKYEDSPEEVAYQLITNLRQMTKDIGESKKFSIAEQLLKEFDLEENPQLSEEEFQFSPEQEKWLGGADRQDPNIIARMPGAKPPITYFKDPADQEIAKKLNFGQQNLSTVKKAMGMEPGAAQTFADPTTAAPQQSAQPADSTQAAQDAEIDQISGEFDQLKQQAAMDKELDAATAQAQANQANATPGQSAPQQSAQPAAPKASTKRDPNVLALQQKLIAAGANIKADGIMGPRTQAAMKQFPQAVSGNIPASAFGVTTPSTAWAGRGGQGGPTAAQMANARAPQQAAQPTNPSVAKIDAELKRFTSQGYDMKLPANQRYVAQLQAQRQAAMQQPAQSAQPAAQPAAQPGVGKAGPTKAAAAGQDPNNPLNQRTEDINLIRKLAGI